MTHYSIDYSTLKGDEKAKQAIKDIIDYVGAVRFIEIGQLMRERYKEKPSLDQFRLMTSFAGVQGYPAEAWYKHIWPETEG